MDQIPTKSTEFDGFQWSLLTGHDEHQTIIPARIHDVKNRLSNLSSDDRDWFTASDNRDTKYFIKIFRHDSCLQRTRYTLFGSQAWHEWQHLMRLYNADIPVPEPIALGQRFNNGLLNACVLFCRYLPGTTLHNVLENQYGTDDWPSIRPHIWNALARVTVQLIENGFYHQDYHDRNLLVTSGTSVNELQDPDMYVTDLHRGTATAQMNNQTMLRMIAFLVYSLHPTVPLWECRRFYEQIQQHLPKKRSSPPFSALLDHLLIRQRTHREKRMRHAFRSASDVSQLQTEDGHIVHHHSPIDREVVDGWITRIRQFDESKADQNQTWTDETSDYTVCTRRIEPGETITTFLKGSPARKAWRNAEGLRVLNVPHRRPLAIVESTSEFDGTPSFLVENVSKNTRPLNNFLTSTSDPHSEVEVENMHRLIRDLAIFVRILHRKGIQHQTLGPNTILIRTTNKHHEFALSEPDHVEFADQPLSLEQRTRNLKKLRQTTAGYASEVNQLRFWKTYIAGASVPPSMRNTAPDQMFN